MVHEDPSGKAREITQGEKKLLEKARYEFNRNNIHIVFETLKLIWTDYILQLWRSIKIAEIKQRFIHWEPAYILYDDIVDIINNLENGISYKKYLDTKTKWELYTWLDWNDPMEVLRKQGERIRQLEDQLSWKTENQKISMLEQEKMKLEAKVSQQANYIANQSQRIAELEKQVTSWQPIQRNIDIPTNIDDILLKIDNVIKDENQEELFDILDAVSKHSTYIDRINKIKDEIEWQQNIKLSAFKDRIKIACFIEKHEWNTKIPHMTIERFTEMVNDREKRFEAMKILYSYGETYSINVNFIKTNLDFFIKDNNFRGGVLRMLFGQILDKMNWK